MHLLSTICHRVKNIFNILEQRKIGEATALITKEKNALIKHISSCSVCSTQLLNLPEDARMDVRNLLGFSCSARLSSVKKSP